MTAISKLRGFSCRCAILVTPLTIPALASAQTEWPLQVWMQVPAAPVAYPAEGRQYLLYELYVTNTASSAVALASVDILDPTIGDSKPLAHFAGKQLSEIAVRFGHDATAEDNGKPIAIDGGRTAVLFLEATVPMGQPLPARLVQRLTYADGRIVEGGTIAPLKQPLNVLGPPVAGSDWKAGDGPSNSPDNHHRRGIFVIDGTMTDSRRFATDWQIVHGGSSFGGDSTLASSYYSLRQPVLAVADAVVVEMRDGAPDNPPGHNERFHPTVPVTFANVGGNIITLDLGNGQYAHYYHLESGSITVKKGDRVTRGQIIAKIGASGDAREPHLHFEVTNAIEPMAGDGMPYVIDRYRVTGGDGYSAGMRTGELPLDGMIVDFARTGSDERK
jgi:hypothetical protein